MPSSQFVYIKLINFKQIQEIRILRNSPAIRKEFNKTKFPIHALNIQQFHRIKHFQIFYSLNCVRIQQIHILNSMNRPSQLILFNTIVTKTMNNLNQQPPHCGWAPFSLHQFLSNPRTKPNWLVLIKLEQIKTDTFIEPN